MILTALIGLLQSILYNFVLFYVGVLLNEPVQLRNYFGIRSLEGDEHSYDSVLHWIKKIGITLMIIAFINALIAVISTITLLIEI